MFLLLQQCSACLVRLIWMVLKMGSRWPYSCYVGCCFQDLFNIAHRNLLQLPSSFFSICLVSIHVVYPYSKLVRPLLGKKLHFLLLYKSDFHMIDNLAIAVHTFVGHVLVSFSVDEMLFMRYMNLTTDFREPPFSVEMSSFLIKMYILWFVCIHMEPNATYCLLQAIQQGFGLGRCICQHYFCKYYYYYHYV